MSLQVKGPNGENLWVLWDGDWKVVSDNDDRFAIVTPKEINSPDAFEQKGDMHFIDKADVDRIVLAPPKEGE